MQLTKQQLQELETPCLVIDADRARENIRLMQKAADEAGCRLRPHIKTHKMPLFARLQTEAGARGITCAKISEAEVMAAGGLEDIFVAYPLVGNARIKRAIKLAGEIRRLIVAVDSRAGAAALNEAAAKQQVTLEVRMEIDTGAGRTGIPMEEAVSLGLFINTLKQLKLTGIYTFKSLVYQGRPTEDPVLAAGEEGQMMAAVAAALN